AKVPAMSSANGLASNNPLPSSVVASNAPDCSASASRAALAPDQTAPADHDRVFGLGDHRSHLLDQHRVRPQNLLAWQQLGRGLVVRQIGKFLALQIERDAEDDRLVLGARNVKGFAHAV